MAKSILTLVCPSSQSIPLQYVEYYFCYEDTGAYKQSTWCRGIKRLLERRHLLTPTEGTTLNQITVNINSCFKKRCPTKSLKAYTTMLKGTMGNGDQQDSRLIEAKGISSRQKDSAQTRVFMLSFLKHRSRQLRLISNHINLHRNCQNHQIRQHVRPISNHVICINFIKIVSMLTSIPPS